MDDAPVSATEAMPVPAVWSAREPECAWCPASLNGTLDAGLVARCAAEPMVLAQSHAAWQLLGVSVRGRSHGHRATHRDDAMAVHDKAVAAGFESTMVPQRLERWPVIVGFINDPDGYSIELMQRLEE